MATHLDNLTLVLSDGVVLREVRPGNAPVAPFTTRSGRGVTIEVYITSQWQAPLVDESAEAFPVATYGMHSFDDALDIARNALYTGDVLATLNKNSRCLDAARNDWSGVLDGLKK